FYFCMNTSISTASYFWQKSQKNGCMPTFCLYNLTMLGKVRLRRNDFLLFHPKQWLNSITMLKISGFLNSKSTNFGDSKIKLWLADKAARFIDSGHKRIKG